MAGPSAGVGVGVGVGNGVSATARMDGRIRTLMHASWAARGKGHTPTVEGRAGRRRANDCANLPMYAGLLSNTFSS